MNSLAIITKTLSPLLLVQEVRALELHSKPKIKDLKRLDLITPLHNALTKAYIVKSQGIPRINSGSETDTLKIMVEELSAELKNNFKHFSIEEIVEAIDLGSKGKLESEFVHISISNILKWIWLYWEKVRCVAVDKQRIEDEKQEKLRTIEEHIANEKKFEAMIIAKLIGYPDSVKGDNYGTLSSYYRHLNKKGLVFLETERKFILQAEAKKIKERDDLEAKEQFKSILIPYTVKEIAEALALEFVFNIWKFEDKQLNFK